MLQSGAVTEFPLCDEEVMLRHMHTVCRDYVEKHKSDSGAVLAGTASSKSKGA
jgi:hypothetical protein